MILSLILAAAAQPAPVDHLHKVVVDAIRNCGAGADGEITVCAPDRGIAEGYRIPRLDPRFAGANLRPSGRGTVATAQAGTSGIGACATEGTAGGMGCSLREIRAWGQGKRERQAAAHDPD